MSKYLYTWTNNIPGTSSDFLAVIDADSKSDTYGQTLATKPVGANHTLAHHAEYKIGPDNCWFANGFFANRCWMFDLNNPLEPKIRTEIAIPPGYSHPHSFARLSGNRVLVSMQFGWKGSTVGPGKIGDYQMCDQCGTDCKCGCQHGQKCTCKHKYGADRKCCGSSCRQDVTKLARDPINKTLLPNGAGGLAIYDHDATLIKVTNAYDELYPDEIYRPYGVEAIEEIDRVVTTNFSMDMDHPASDLLQIWRISDMKLMKTVRMSDALTLEGGRPPPEYGVMPFELRAIKDKTTGKYRIVLITAKKTAIFVLDEITSDNPVLTCTNVINGDGGAAVSLIIDHYFLQAVENDHTVYSFDVSNPYKPKMVSKLELTVDDFPHLISADLDGSRIIITDFQSPMQNITRPSGVIYIANFNKKTGELTLDEKFSSNNNGLPGVNQRRTLDWPGMDNVGGAVSHAAVFGPYVEY